MKNYWGIVQFGTKQWYIFDKPSDEVIDFLALKNDSSEIFNSMYRYTFNDMSLEPEFLELIRISHQQEDSKTRPKHYGKDNPFEAIKIIEYYDLNFNLGNVIKYVTRAGKKDRESTIDDLKKAAWYAAREVERLENES